MDADTIVTDLGEREWDEYVDAHRDATGYHKWLWRRVFEGAFGHPTVYFAALEQNRVTGVLPTVIFENRLFGRFMVSLPFVNYGGVLSNTQRTASALVERASQMAMARRLRFIELRHQTRTLPALAARQHKVAMRMALAADEPGALQALDRKVRNQIRKATKSGLAGAHGGPELLHDFYAVFCQNMRDLGTPVYPLRFFQAVLSELGSAARVFVVRDGSQCVAAAIACRYRDTIEVPWASSLRSHREVCPNNLLYWNVICYAIAEGLRTLDFGRSTPGEGTFHFKKQWGAEPSPLVWEYWLAAGASMPDFSPKNPRVQPAIALWKRLPVPVTAVIGPSIVRNIP